MERLRNWALRLIILLNVIATVVAFGESYNGLYRWAFQHQVVGFWAGVWPLMVDLMILVAEAGLFVAHHDKWKMRHKAWLWSVATTALAVSVGGNTGHIQSHDWLSHLTAALPPVALLFTMTVGFGVMKRTFLNKPASAPIRTESFPLTNMVPITPTRAERPAPTPVPVPAETPPERPASVLPVSLEPTETFAGVDFTVTDRSWTAPKDPRTGLDLKRQRVRDMYDLDPDISVNAITKALGIAWDTACKYLAETKEARGLPLTEVERKRIT